MVAVERPRYAVAIVAGDGLVARFGDVAVVLAEPGASVAPLIEAAKAAAGTPDPGATLADRLAPLALRGGPAGARFGATAPTKGGLLVLLRGNVTAEFDSPEGARRLSGERAMTWVDEVLPAGVQQVSVRCAQGAAPATECPHTDLQAGVVPGGGFVVRPVDASQPAASDATQTLVSARTPVRGQPIEGPTMTTGEAPVLFGRPHGGTETFTAQAAIAVLVADDGAVYPLDRSYVLGRDPLSDEAVSTGRATPIALQGDSHISRVHAFVSVDAGAVQVRDASTPGGTFIAAPGAPEWTRIGASPADLPLGWSLRVGERIFTCRSESGG